MPTPVSCTRMSMYSRSPELSRTSWPPGGVNLTAFDSRFTRPAAARTASPVIRKSPAATSAMRFTLLAVATGRRDSRAASQRWRSGDLAIEAEVSRRNPRDVEEILDELRLEARVAADDFERLGAPLLVTAPCRSMLVHPRIAFSGVRSSCDSVARNSSFARSAFCANARASRSRTMRRRSSESLRWSASAEACSSDAWRACAEPALACARVTRNTIREITRPAARDAAAAAGTMPGAG